MAELQKEDRWLEVRYKRVGGGGKDVSIKTSNPFDVVDAIYACSCLVLAVSKNSNIDIGDCLLKIKSVVSDIEVKPKGE